MTADLAARLLRVDADEVDDAIVDGLRRLAEGLDLDQIILWRVVEETQSADVALCWTKQRTPLSPEPWPLASMPLLLSQIMAGESLWFARLDDLTDPVDRDTFQRHAMLAAACVPMVMAEGAETARSYFTFSSATPHEWPLPVLDHLRLVAAVIGQALSRKVSAEALERSLGELYRLRACVAEEGLRGRPNPRMLRASRLIVSESEAVRRAIAQAEQVAPTPATVLLLGETGVGKEVFAQAIHELSPRHSRQMIRVSCAAIPNTLIESELFGRERGAYTGALTRQMGRFEAAHQSTIFLDEIGELSADVQVKLLNVIQDRVVQRLGSTQSTRVDVRIIAATNRNLQKMVDDKAFREDLYYRLNVFPIVVPPLRERVDDISGLVWEFVNEYARLLGKTIDSISRDSLRTLQQYHWPGNVRELRNVVERAVIVATGPHLTIPIPQQAAPRPMLTSMTLRELETEHIRATLESTNRRIRGHGGAAERLGLKPTTLESRIAKLGLGRTKNM